LPPRGEAADRRRVRRSTAISPWRRRRNTPFPPLCMRTLSLGVAGPDKGKNDADH
jgi:hypothetical protein